MTYKDGGKSGGRKPGSKNKLTLARAKALEELKKHWNGALPENAFKGNALELIQYFYKHPDTDPLFAVECASKAMQFEVPKKSEATIEDNRSYVVRMPADTPGKMPKEQLDNWLKLYGEESIASTSLADKKNTIQ
jgi:hypothetical protein